MTSNRPRLLEARTRAGLTQSQLGALVGSHQPTIVGWESGKQVPRADIAIRLAKALGTTVEAIWGDNENGGRAVATADPLDRRMEETHEQQRPAE